MRQTEEVSFAPKGPDNPSITRKAGRLFTLEGQRDDLPTPPHNARQDFEFYGLQNAIRIIKRDLGGEGSEDIEQVEQCRRELHEIYG